MKDVKVIVRLEIDGINVATLTEDFDGTGWHKIYKQIAMLTHHHEITEKLKKEKSGTKKSTKRAPSSASAGMLK